MAGSNGFGTLAQLRALKRLETTYTKWPVMKIRLQALYDDDLIRVTEYARAEGGDTNDVIRSLRDREASIALAMVNPPLAELAVTDFAEAVAYVKTRIPPGVQADLSLEISGLTWRNPAQAYKDFSDGEGSHEAEADTTDSTSISANS